MLFGDSQVSFAIKRVVCYHQCVTLKDCRILTYKLCISQSEIKVIDFRDRALWAKVIMNEAMVKQVCSFTVLRYGNMNDYSDNVVNEHLVNNFQCLCGTV